MPANKITAAKKALSYLETANTIGIGTGSTVECLLDLLNDSIWHTKTYCVSSTRTYHAMIKRGFKNIIHSNDIIALDVYIDGADWIDSQGVAIKGYGGALTQEKLLAAMSILRIAIVEKRKLVPTISGLIAPLPIEVLTIAGSYVTHRLYKMGARAIYRAGVITDQGFPILDIYDLPWSDSLEMEHALQIIPGVIECGLFANESFHVVLSE